VDHCDLLDTLSGLIRPGAKIMPRAVTILKRLTLVLTVSLLLVPASHGSLNAQANSTPAPDVTNKTIAVTSWEPLGDAASNQEWLSEALRKLVTQDLSRISDINVIGADQYLKTLSKNDLLDANPNETDTAREIARAAEADVLLIGTYQIRNNRIQLSAVFYDPLSQQTLTAHSEQGRLGNIKSLETKLVEEILRKANVSLGSSERNWLRRDKQLETDQGSLDQPPTEPQSIGRETEAQSLYQALQREGAGALLPDDMIVGIHWPGVSIGYKPTPITVVEFRAESNSDITVLGGRFNRYIYHFGESSVYWGTQVSHISFEGEVSEGTGLLGGGFLGVEQYVTENSSFKADFGTYFTSLEDDQTGVSVSGIGFSLVTGLAYHF
jgi:TolB-like protein